MAGELADKVILVTGGAQGIGRACGLAFGREGAKAVIADIDLAGAPKKRLRSWRLAVSRWSAM
jgi:NAD(P)-dependent dehydrogenase (short-subunit alcohol dehydrogenase family)